MREGKIKVLSESQKILDVIKKVESYEGVVNATLEGDVITYFF